MASWTAPRTWVDGETETATIFNTHVRDNLLAIAQAWTSYTPAWTSTGTAPAIGNGTITGAYQQVGKMVLGFRISIVFGSTTTYGTGNYLLSLPVAPTSYRWRFPGVVADSGVADRTMWGRSLGGGATTVELVTATGTTTADVFVTATAPHTLGTSDYFTLQGTYEAA